MKTGKKLLTGTLLAICTALLVLCSVLAIGWSKAAKTGDALPEVRNNGTAIQWKYSDEADWHDLVALTELRGAAGENGKNGTDGKDGSNGADGKDGINGTNGKDGINGSDGKDGKDGINGVDGKDGADGKNGKDGIVKHLYFYKLVNSQIIVYLCHLSVINSALAYLKSRLHKRSHTFEFCSLFSCNHNLNPFSLLLCELFKQSFQCVCSMGNGILCF